MVVRVALAAILRKRLHSLLDGHRRAGRGASGPTPVEECPWPPTARPPAPPHLPRCPTIRPRATSSAAAAPTTELGDLETGTDPWQVSVSGGTTAALTGSTDAPTSGSALARFTVTPGTGPAEMVRGTGDLDLTALDLQLRSTTVGEVVLRLTDATGQVHQQVLTIATDGSWHPVTVDTFAGRSAGPRARSSPSTR